ncbi:tRNA pseudouridine(38-40) synthase TruA [bacterium]|nr:tRNA pseudouridine(38-40) synthase TruA [bacterium]MBU0899781.1 tRNA pseudouridine(38-40) synthase TruA [bacterium]MBU1153601.1 tRNA pseudouridine(38-40) synthase TruA [bacterium]MBU1782576.1 tRNA pseudouridine(38-40) synthase TruA [bacterium]MBU2600238.1 tRNA pseudouridine(38-40) synthase TruA [bacterium]
MKNIKLVVAYDGTNYFGWQKQSHLRTIGGMIEEKLSQICNEKVKLLSAGRTDKGVHSLGQVVNFKTKTNLKVEIIEKALNSLLPKDIVILKGEEVNEKYHARFSAVFRTYQYLVLNQETYSPFCRNYMWWVKDKLNLRRMRLTSKYFLGQHDFSPFSTNLKEIKNPQREVKEVRIIKEKNIIKFIITANAFLPHMARGIVGVLIEAGKGRLSIKEIRDILEGREKKVNKVIFASPCGLYLLKVGYLANK